jgi:hypothetical protein
MFLVSTATGKASAQNFEIYTATTHSENGLVIDNSALLPLCIFRFSFSRALHIHKTLQSNLHYPHMYTHTQGLHTLVSLADEWNDQNKVKTVTEHGIFDQSTFGAR